MISITIVSDSVSSPEDLSGFRFYSIQRSKRNDNERKERKKVVKAMKKVLVCTMAAALTLGSAQLASAATSPTQAPKPVTKNNVKASGVTVNTKSNGTAVLTKAKSGKKVSVASKITVKGVKYTVTVINAKAFSKKTTQVTLPATIKTINKSAFTGAKKLKKIVINSKKSITVKKGAFKGLNTKKITIQAKKMSKKELKKFKKALKKAGFKGKVK